MPISIKQANAAEQYNHHNLFSVTDTETENKTSLNAAQRQLSLGLCFPAQHHEMCVNGSQWGSPVLFSKHGLHHETFDKLVYSYPLSKSYNKAVEQLAQLELFGKQDVYITPNEFKFQRRLLKNLVALNANFVDIDWHGRDYREVDSSSELQIALDKLDEAGFPHPSVIVFSGRGLHLYWLYKQKVPAQALARWQQIQNKLIKTLDADFAAKDATRVLRIIGTNNSEAGNRPCVGRWHETQNRYSFEYLYSQIIGERKQLATVTSLEKARVKKQRKATGSIYERWRLVYLDILTLVDYLFPEGVPESGIDNHGRNFFLFHAANALSWFTSFDSLYDEIVDLAKRITPSVSDSDINHCVSSILNRAEYDFKNKIVAYEQWEYGSSRYRYTAKRLWADFEKIVPELLLPQLRAIVPPAVSRARKTEAEYKRKHKTGERKMTRSEYLSENQGTIEQVQIELRNGLKVPAIARKLGVSDKSIYRWITQGRILK